MIFKRNKLLRNEFYKWGNDMRELSYLINTNIEQISNMMQKSIIEEIDAYIEHTKQYTSTPIYKNGYTTRSIYTLNGEITLEVPRLRNDKRFCSQILSKYQKCHKDFEHLIAVLLSHFNSYDFIINIIYQLTGIKIGHSIIARISKRLKEKYLETYEFQIESDIYALFVDASYHKVKRWYNLKTGEYKLELC
ncbi:Transposase, Mutator family [Mycoplasmopsis verecunda]|uniref:Mutator family transposase n=1 Tax=Mycoplasmopsis verecunda TaxID=171291 RepID=A0A1T4M785_9BACT|nr:Transposase, Mutator family [Mycoplasmopsis verecunda]